jgi:hypothetical protein
MKNEWDIVDAVSPSEDLTEPQSNPRRIARGPAALSVAVLMFGSVFNMSATTVMPLADSASDVISVVYRARKDVLQDKTKRPLRRPNSGVDFTLARSGDSLARAFNGYFRPPLADEQEAEPDNSCFF